MQKYYDEKSLKIFFESEFRNLKIHGYLIRLWVRMYLVKSIILFLKIGIYPPPSIQIFAISLKIIIFLCSQLIYFRLLNKRLSETRTTFEKMTFTLKQSNIPCCMTDRPKYKNVRHDPHRWEANVPLKNHISILDSSRFSCLLLI